LLFEWGWLKTKTESANVGGGITKLIKN